MRPGHPIPRPSPAFVLAAIALFVALGGSAVALQGRNSVDGGDIRSNVVKSKHVRDENLTGTDLRDGAVLGVDVGDASLGGADLEDGTVASPDVANDSLTGQDVNDDSLAGADVDDGSLSGDDVDDGTLTGDDVGPNSLTGADIDESSLAQVPSAVTAASANSATSATNAANATNVDGLQVRAFHYAANANSGNQSFLSLGGLAIVGSCDAAGNIQLSAAPQTNDSYIRSSNNQSDPDFDVGQTIDLDTPDNDGARFVALRRGPAAAGSTTFDSTSVSAIVVYDSNPGAGPACQASGTAMGRP